MSVYYHTIKKDSYNLIIKIIYKYFYKIKYNMKIKCQLRLKINPVRL